MRRSILRGIPDNNPGLYQFLKDRLQVLEDFDIRCSLPIINHMTDLYPDNHAADRYMRDLIFKKLDCA